MGRKRIEHKIIYGVECKMCSRCKQWKPLSEFRKRSKATDGLKSTCKECLSKDDHSYYLKNQDKVKQYAIDNAEHIAAYKAKWYQEHKEEHSEYMAMWYQEHTGYMTDKYSTLEGTAYKRRYQNLIADRKYGRVGKNEDPLPSLEYYIWALQQPDFYDGKRYPFNEMGLDRIDNTKPHTIDNVVPCSTKNNLRRQKIAFGEFVELIKMEKE